jgi:excisionase family DNA binding protein
MVAEKQWLSIAEAARELGVTETTVIRGVEAGRIEAVRLGETNKAARIHRHALMPWLKSDFNRRQAAQQTALVARMREQRLVVERMEAEIERERRRLGELQREVEHEVGGSMADDGRHLRVV